MESHTCVTLFLLSLCLAFSLGGARHLAPSGSPTGGPAASPIPSEDSAFGSGSDSPEGSVAMNDLVTQFKGSSANDAVNEAVKYVSELEGPMPSMESFRDGMAPAASKAMNSAKNTAKSVKDELAPAASAVMNKAAALGPVATTAMHKAAAWAAEITGPSPN